MWFIAKLNKVIRSKNKVKECLAQIDVVLKRRYDLIPNIVSVVKGCTNHESKTLEEVTKMRTNALKTKDKKEEMELNNNISKDINQILLLSESYPELKSNENYLSLQLELSATEDEIAKEREEYNNAVLKYKNIIETIPTNIFANILGYKDESFFSTDDDESKNHKLDLKN